MKKTKIVEITIGSFFLLVLLMLIICCMKVHIVCVPAGKHLNKDKYVTIKEAPDSLSYPIRVSKIYYMDKKNDR